MIFPRPPGTLSVVTWWERWRLWPHPIPLNFGPTPIGRHEWRFTDPKTWVDMRAFLRENPEIFRLDEKA